MKTIIKSKIFILLLLFLCFSLNIYAAQTSTQQSQYLVQTTLCKNVLEKEPFNKTNYFQPMDEKVVCWIQFDYSSQYPFAVTWEWVDPTGNKYHTGEIKMEKGDYIGYRTWYWIGIRDHYAEKLSGSWKVNLYIDGLLLATEEFNIE